MTVNVTKAELAAPDGSTLVGYIAPGSTATARTVQDHLRDEPLHMEDYYEVSDGPNYAPAIKRVTDYYQASSVNPPLPDAGWGKGVVLAGRGTFPLSEQIEMSSIQGGGLKGHAQYSTVFTRNFSGIESGIYLGTYVGVTLSDFTLLNQSPTRGQSFGLFLDPIGGGGELRLDKLSITGFNYGIYVNGDIVSGNGDKTLVTGCTLINNVGWSNGGNKQAIGWTFLNFNGGCSKAFFEYGGAGETLAINGTVNIVDTDGAILKLPEGAGTAIGGVFTLQDTKVEYHGTTNPGDNQFLINAAESVLNADAGGSRVVVRLRGVTVGSGPSPLNIPGNTIIKVGNGTGGSDEIAVQADSGSFEGVIEVASAVESARQTRWHFRDMKRSPDPATVRFQGTGNHPLIEWTGCDGRLDQYRGGQHVNGAIPAELAYRYHHLSRYLVNTGVADNRKTFTAAQLGRPAGSPDRFGFDFVIEPGFAPNCTITGVAAFIADAGFDTLIQWYRDPGFTNLIGENTIPAGAKGLRPVVCNDTSKWFTVGPDKRVYVRVSMAQINTVTVGDLVIFYYPYMGV